MPISRSSANRLRLVLIGALSAIICGGCATTPSERPTVRTAPNLEARTSTAFPAAAVSVTPTLKPVLRYGRYTLVEVSALAGQEDLLQQIVDITMPQALTTSVGDALRYVLLRSGLSLCDSPEIRILNTLPLPAADFHLGPLTLETALRLLAGPAWKLEVDDLARRVCLVPNSPAAPSGKPARTSPTKDGTRAQAPRPMTVPREERP